MNEEEFWTMKDGSKIAVADMNTRHLRNVLRSILRAERKRRIAAALDLIIRGNENYLEINEAAKGPAE